MQFCLMELSPASLQPGAFLSPIFPHLLGFPLHTHGQPPLDKKERPHEKELCLLSFYFSVCFFIIIYSKKLKQNKFLLKKTNKIIPWENKRIKAYLHPFLQKGKHSLFTQHCGKKLGKNFFQGKNGEKIFFSSFIKKFSTGKNRPKSIFLSGI